MEDDITVVNLGKIDETIEVIVVYPIVKGYEYAMCPLDYDLLTHIYNIMPELVLQNYTYMHVCVYSTMYILFFFFITDS